MRNSKAKPDDEFLIYDEKANINDRLEAMNRLAFDGFYKMQPYLEKLLSHQNHFLRAEAIKILVGRWEKGEYLKKAFDLLHNDFDWNVRCDAAFSLAEFVKYSEKNKRYKDQILKELMIALINDSDESVQRKAFEKSYEIILGKYPDNHSIFFDREEDVDWRMLQPYLEKFGLQKPN